jgi:RHS repeat-associated protein
MLCALLITCLLSTSMPAATSLAVGAVIRWQQDARFWLRSSGWEASALGFIRGNARPSQKGQEKQDERNGRIRRIQVYPGGAKIKVGERVFFTAVAYDKDEAPLAGVQFTWKCLEEGRNLTAHISPQGEFFATATGNFKVTVEGGGRTEHVRIEVGDGVRPKASDIPTGPSKKVSTRDLPSSQTASLSRKGSEERTSAHASRRRAASPAPAAMMVAAEGWDETNYQSADDPDNRIGDTPGGVTDGGAGSGNFQIAAPVINLPGRSMNLALALAYNSRLWNKSGSDISYDVDRGWPAPGWNLGFSKVLGMGVWGGSMIVEADGSRHAYTGNVTPYSWGTIFKGHTVDGSFIDYWHQTGTGGAITYAEATYPNGTVIKYGVQGEGAMYPTEIADAQGNYIRITYAGQNYTGPQIATITDTVGRTIIFHYDANNLLTAITGPDIQGGVRTLVRLQYRQLPLETGFSGLVARARNYAPYVINAIYYPGTNTGYWFGDADSYSSYGMIAKVVEQRGMSFSAASLNEQGTITPGTMTRQSVYNYDLQPNYSLTDAPTYTSQTDAWEGMEGGPHVTTYNVQQNANPRRVEVIRPDGLRNVQLSYNYSNLSDGDPNKFRDGLVYQDETYDQNGALLGSGVTSWDKGAYDSARPTRVEVTDERGQKTAVEFDYGAAYNQVIEVRDYDYGGQTLMRKTTSGYENGANYTNRHIFSLVKWVEVYAGDAVTRLSRTDYEYDGAPLVDTPGVVQFKETNNPFAPTVEYCDWRPKPSNPDIEIYYCENVNPYNPATAYRGNVTAITTYADAVNLTGAVTETRRYDRTGNMVSTSSSCCEQTSNAYTANTQYAYKETVTRGSAATAAAQVTTSAAYDLNTGLMVSATDANGLTSQTNYFAESLRPREEITPTGARVVYAYDDYAMKATVTTYASAAEGAAVVSQSEKFLNGLDQIRQERALAGDGIWDIIDTRYDLFGRVTKQSRPYREGEQPQWAETVYDSIGRVTSVKASDGSETKSFYNESVYPGSATPNTLGRTSRTVDAWGRERWGRMDSAGRLVEVVEPAPAGNGSVFEAGSLLTKYSYDTLGNLIEITQGDQHRRFKYDSLGRLTHQKLAEANATLNDLGQYVGSSGEWSDYFTYDSDSNMSSRTDARGVKTIFSYKDAAGNDDPLNRLRSVSYDTSGDPLQSDPYKKVLPAASVTYEYMTSGDITRARRITTEGVSTEEFGYDSAGRVNSKTLTLFNRPSYPMVSEYVYDSLNRVTDVRYPAQYGAPNAPRKLVHHDYDVASRVSNLQVDGVSFASGIEYNAASQTKKLKVGTGDRQVTENYEYDVVTGLLSNQTVVRGTGAAATRLLDLSYGYLRAGTSSGRTGQLTSVTDNLDATHAKDRAYKYDALGRLVEAAGGQASAPVWTQAYAYDRYGNRQSVTATGSIAGIKGPDMPQATPPTEQLASNTEISMPATMRESSTTGGISDTPFTPFSSARTSSATTTTAAFAPQPSSSIVISQVYGGGGNAGATYKNDFVELFNRGSSTVDLTGWSVQYAAAGSATWQVTQLTGSLAPGHYYLVREAQGAGGTVDLPTPDAMATVELNATAGKVALVNSPTPLSGTCTATSSGVVDFVGYGNSAGCYEGGGPAASPSNTTSILRASGGFIETDNNATDFDAGAPSPRNSGSPPTSGEASYGSATIVISEFRTRGPAGGSDEFLELYNKSESAVNIGGWKLKVSNNAGAISTRLTISAGTILPAHAHFLITNTGAGGYGGAVAGDQGYSSGVSDDGGFAITRADDSIVDQVGMSYGSAFKENRVLQALTTNADRSYERKAGGAAGSTQDTNDGPSDFQLRTPSDPQNLASAPTPQTPSNQPPVVNIGGPYSGTAGVAVEFNGSNSTDADGTITSYEWKFGDGETTTGATPQHAYASAGTYTVTLTVTDNAGARASATASVTINATPPPPPSSGSTDGIASLSYNTATNRINNAGWDYDAAGNQTRVQTTGGAWQRYQYDAANRLVYVRADNQSILSNYTYGASNARLSTEEGGLRTYYVWDGGGAIMEYMEGPSQSVPQWSKSYVYLGARLLSSITPGGAGELIQYHHPDMLGTRLVTNAQDDTHFAQATLPFGTALESETSGATTKRFTSYDRSNVTGLDYAVNRHYDSGQGRFTQVDPIGMRASSLENPQTLNLYTYCGNDPINHTDPDGLFFGFLKKLFKGIGKVFSAVANAVAKVLNNRWVRIGVFIAGFFLPGIGQLSQVLFKVIDTALKIYNEIADITGLLQMAGQVLQGKFKEFFIGVGMAFIGSMLATVEDGIIKGMQDGLFKKGYGGNFLEGAWRGFKNGLDKLGRQLRALIEFKSPFYANFCGGGNVDADSVDPVDNLDSKCKGHDKGTDQLPGETREDFRKKVLAEDKKLLKSLLSFKSAPKIHMVDIAFGGRVGGPSVGTVFKFGQILTFATFVLTGHQSVPYKK